MKRANPFHIHFSVLFVAASSKGRILLSTHGSQLGRSPPGTFHYSTAIVAALLNLPPELTITAADAFAVSPAGTLQLI